MAISSGSSSKASFRSSNSNNPSSSNCFFLLGLAEFVVWLTRLVFDRFEGGNPSSSLVISVTVRFLGVSGVWRSLVGAFIIRDGMGRGDGRMNDGPSFG